MVDVVHRRAAVADLHAVDPFADGPIDGPQVWWCDFADAAMVLGSRQAPDVVDPAACERAGLGVVRRRSGGGAVLLRPGAVAWLDVLLPHGLAPDDVRGSMVWIGERWREALAAQAAPGTLLEVHRGGIASTPWSDLVCFAGLGPGEVLADGRKLVGLSQRRTRHGLRVQGQLHLRPLLAEMPPLFAVTTPEAPLDEPASWPELDVLALVDALVGALAGALASSRDGVPHRA
jgi:lipoate-protein ligase A